MLISFVRTVILFGLMAVAMRLLGKRQVGELEPTELVVTILISELVVIPMQDLSVPLLAGIVPLLAILGLNLLLSHVLLKSVKLRKWVEGKPSILVRNGLVVKRELKKNGVSIDELLESLRLKSVTDLRTVQYAILETSGQLSVLLYDEHRPPTAGELAGRKAGAGLPVTVVSDGRWLDDNLAALQLSRSWVEHEIGSRGGRGVKDVFLMTVDEKKQVYYLSQREAERVL